nr:hypothetical protein [uncultured Agrobacterium sp.]
MPEQSTETTPEEQLLQAAKTILGYEGMAEFIAAGDAAAAYGILTTHLAALKNAVEASETAAE